jgi:hypothetical protein
MPYELKNVNEAKSLYKVCKTNDKNKCFSKKGLRKFVAIKQKKAIELNERRRKIGGYRRLLAKESEFNEWYKKFTKEAKDVGIEDNEMLDFDMFKDLFTNKYENTTLDIDRIILELVKANILNGNEEKGKSRSRSASSSSASTISKAYEDYLQMIDDHNGNTGDLKALDEDEFRQKYMEIDEDENGNMDVDEIILKIINKQEEDRLISDDAKIELAGRWRMFLLDKPISYTEDANGRKEYAYDEAMILSDDDITVNKTINEYVNYNDLNDLYEFLKKDLENAPAKVKKRKAYLINTNYIDDDPLIKTFHYVTQKVGYYNDTGNIGENWCVDKCDGDSRRWTLLRHSDFYMIICYLNDDNDIVFSGCGECYDGSNNIEIKLLCAGNYGFTVFECFKEVQNKGSKYVFCPTRKKYDYLKLWSVPNYYTVEFYWSQGLCNQSDQTEKALEKFKDIIEEKELEKRYPSRYALIQDFIEKIEEKDCEFLNLIYESTECGQNKFYFPNQLDKNLKPTVLNTGTDHVNMREAFLEILKIEALDERNQKGYEAKERIKERFQEIKRNAFQKEAEQVRSELQRKLIQKSGLPISKEEKEKRNKLNKQVLNVLTKLDEAGLPPGKNDKSVSKLSNKPRFAEKPMSLDERQRQTAINRLKGNEPRTEYKRMKQLREFGDASVRNLAIDPFETGHHLVPGPRNRRTGRNVMVEPPQEAPFTTKDYIITRGSGVKGTKFYEELRSYGINPEDYLKQMKKWAKASGYDDKQLTLDNNDKNKLRIMTEQGTKHFGRVGYKDYYIYRHLEKKKEVKIGYA